MPSVVLPDHIRSFVPSELFPLDLERFAKKLRGARKGAAPGPSGMTANHLRILLDDDNMLRLLFKAALQISHGNIPNGTRSGIRTGRLTALQKDDGGVRGIVAGDILRRIVARTIAQQIGKEVEEATAPYQFALSTRAGTECVGHALQAKTSMNKEYHLID